MSLNLSKRSILKKATQVGMLTFLSRMLGITREFLMIRYFGPGAALDAFIAAFKLPNFFRHIFAEGALSASFVPAIVKTVKQGNKEEANGLMSISFLFFEGLVLLLYGLVLFKTEWLLLLVAPGFSPEQIGYTIPFLRILFSFLFFISSSALLAGALNSVNHFFIPAFATPLWNVVYILTLLVCLAYKLPYTYLCFGIILGAFIQFLAHLIVFLKLGFKFGRIDAGVVAAFKSVLAKFLPCLFGVSIAELNLFISLSIASYLPQGSISLLHLGSRFAFIPLGMFAVALSSVMLPHFSRLVLYAPKRLNFYLLEVAKFVTWVIVPTMFFIMFCSQELFLFLLGSKATPELVRQGGIILTMYTSGLLFLCVNKILLSMFYALKDTTSTAIASASCAAINIIGDLVGIRYFGAYGIGIANTVAAGAMTVLCFFFLYKKHDLKFYVASYCAFAMRYALQLTVVGGLFLALFVGAQRLATAISFGAFFAHGIGFWIVVFPLAAGSMSLLFLTRRYCNIDVYFLKR